MNKTPVRSPTIQMLMCIITKILKLMRIAVQFYRTLKPQLNSVETAIAKSSMA